MRLAKVWSPVNLSGQHQAAGDFASFLPGSHLRKVTDANALALSLDPSSDTAGCVGSRPLLTDLQLAPRSCSKDWRPMGLERGIYDRYDRYDLPCSICLIFCHLPDNCTVGPQTLENACKTINQAIQ